MTHRLASLLFLLLSLSLAAPAQGVKIQPIEGGSGPPGVSDTVRSALEPAGSRVMLGNGSPLCEVWLRTGLPPQAGKEVSGALYPEFAESALLGVISFPGNAGDYRGQTIKSGVFSMRYALLPNDGNHMGAAPSRDFVVLIPIADDQRVENAWKLEELIKASSKVSGTPHAAILSLAGPRRTESAPAVVSDQSNHIVLVSSIKSQAGAAIQIALVVKGQAE